MSWHVLGLLCCRYRCWAPLQAWHRPESMVQDAGIAGMCTMLTRCWYKDSFELLWHERYVLVVHRVQPASPRNIAFGGSLHYQHAIAIAA